MIRSLIVALLALTMATTTQAAAPLFAKVGEIAPNFVATDTLHNTSVDLSKLRGKVVVLEWNNFSCPFTQKHYRTGNMQKLQREAIADGVVWITINSSADGKEGFLKDSKAVVAAEKEHDADPSHYVLDHDGKIGRLFGATATPHMFVIDKDGTLAYAGAIDDKPTPFDEDITTANNYVREALKALKDGKPVKVPQTHAYGCGVKYAF